MTRQRMPQPLPPTPTEPGSYVLSQDGRSWELEAPPPAPQCSAPQPTEAPATAPED